MSQARRIGEVLWEIPVDARPDMRVPARVFADEELFEAIERDGSLEQTENVATLPGIVEAALAMPDAHQGYGLPVGGVAATELPDGVVSPGGVGYDINCGVRLLRTDLDFDEARPHIRKLVEQLFRDIPSGVGQSGNYPFPKPELAKLMVVTEGRRGCLIYERGKPPWRSHAFRPAREVDPTGAGDVFAASYATQYRRTGNPRASADFANAAASFVLEKRAWQGIPSPEAVADRLKRGKRRGIGMFVAPGARELLVSERRAAFADRFVEPLLAEARKLGLGPEDLAVIIRDRAAAPVATTEGTTR